MPAPKGNKNAIGNRGGGRESAYKEVGKALELQEMWTSPYKLQEAMEAIKCGRPALKHIFIATAAQDGGERLLDTIAKRYFPEEEKLENNQPVVINIINYLNGGDNSLSVRPDKETIRLPAQDTLESGTV